MQIFVVLDDKQRGVLKGIVLGAATTIVVVAIAILANPLSLVSGTSAAERIAYALKADTLVAICLAVSIARLARHRFFTPDDIDGGGLTHATPQAELLQSSLQNTLEQTALAVTVHLIWAVSLPLTWMSVIPAAAILFVIGRVLFARGYEGGAPSRALGFALTFYPSVLMLILIIANLLGAIII